MSGSTCSARRTTRRRFLLYEWYATDEAALAHRETPHFQAWVAAVTDWLVEPRHADVYQPLWPEPPVERRRGGTAGAGSVASGTVSLSQSSRQRPSVFPSPSHDCHGSGSARASPASCRERRRRAMANGCCWSPASARFARSGCASSGSTSPPAVSRCRGARPVRGRAGPDSIDRHVAAARRIGRRRGRGHRRWQRPGHGQGRGRAGPQRHLGHGSPRGCRVVASHIRDPRSRSSRSRPPPGTGSEATRNAVVTVRGEHGFKRSFRDDRLIAADAIVDPDLMAGASPAAHRRQRARRADPAARGMDVDAAPTR